MLSALSASGSATTTVAATLTIAAITYAVWKAIYNVYLHPLSVYPGPTLRAAFTFPDAISKVRGTSFKEINALHRQYGDVVRLAPNSLSYISKEAWKDIFALKADRSELGKDPAYYIARTNLHILNAKQADHARMRKVIAPAFADGVLISQEMRLQRHLDQFVNRLNGAVDGKDRGRVDLVTHLNWFAFDVIGDLVLGQPLGNIEDERYLEWIKNVFASIQLGEFVRVALSYPIIGLGFIIWSQLTPSVLARRKAFMGYTGDKVEARKEQASGQQDFIEHVLRGNKSQATLTPGEILSNCRILFIAGSETTATHLSGAVWHLLKHPDKLERLQREIRSSFESAEQITVSAASQVGRLPYLNAVTQESFRCYPSVAGILPRVTNKDGNNIAGRFVPGKTTVGVHQWSAYHSERNFHKPEQFLPERWLPDAPAEFVNDQKDVLQPFHVGPRGCLGKSLAYLEIRSIMARLLWNFDLKLESESNDWMAHQREFTLWDKPSLWVTLTRKKST